MEMHEIKWSWCPHVAEHEIARDYLISLAKRQKARNTLEGYARDLDDLLDAFAGMPFKVVIDADVGQLERYIDGLYNRAPKRRIGSTPTIARMSRPMLAKATIRRRVVAARLFYQWLIDRKLRADAVNPVPRGAKGVRRGPVPVVQQEPWIPGDDVWMDILRHFFRRECLRNQVLLLVCYDGALRRAECLGLRVDDINWRDRTITVRAETTKNKRERIVALSKVTYEKLEEYVTTERARLVADYGSDEDGPIFLSESHRNPGRPITVWTFNDVMERTRAVVGTPALTPHKLRHLMLTDLTRGGMALDEVGRYAGHASLASTELYVHRDKRTLARHVQKVTAWRDAQVQRLIAEMQDDE